MIKDLIKDLLEKKDLTSNQMKSVMEEILEGTTDTSDIVEFLTSLKNKGETVEELTAAVNVMLKYVDPIIVNKPNILDTCGTGGDKKGTFNISTVSAFVSSGAGVTVAKHGNRSVSSKCGSADLLEALGVNINMSKDRIKKSLEEIDIAFLFAPNLHPAMRHVMPARKQIGSRTMFNILGPLINPARATNQLIGVYSPEWTKILAMVLHNLGTRHVLVVHGEDGLDEVTTTDKTLVSEVYGGKLTNYEVSPEDFGLKKSSIEDLIARDISDSVRITTEILKGVPGPGRDIVILNSGFAIYAANKAKSIKEGIQMAVDSLDSGKALNKLNMLKEYSNAQG